MSSPYTPQLFREPYRPEICHAAELRFRRLLSPTHKVLEFGSGNSTIWLLEIGCKVVSYEPDRAWYKEVKAYASSLGLSGRLDLRLLSKTTDLGRQLSSGEFDLSFIDGIDDDRLDLARLSKTWVRETGTIVVDDTHWDRFNGMFEEFVNCGWYPETIGGMHTRKDLQVKYHQTSFFRRQNDVLSTKAS